LLIWYHIIGFIESGLLLGCWLLDSLVLVAGDSMPYSTEMVEHLSGKQARHLITPENGPFDSDQNLDQNYLYLRLKVPNLHLMI